MKMGKKLVAALLLVVLVFSLAACGSKGIVGKWQLDVDATLLEAGVPKDQLEMARSALGSRNVSMEFTKDGKVTMTGYLMGEIANKSGTYTLDGDQLALDGEQFTIKLDGNKLTFLHPEISLVFKRK